VTDCQADPDQDSHWSKKTGGMKHLPRGATAGGVRDFDKDAGGRPLSPPPAFEPKSVTLFLDGCAYFDDLRHPDLTAIRNLIDECESKGYPLQEQVIDRLDPSFQQPSKEDRRKWTTKHVTQRDFLTHLHENPQSTVRDLARALYGPFKDSDDQPENYGRLTYSENKVRVRLSQLRRKGLVVKERAEQDIARWSAPNPPEPLPSSHPNALRKTKPPELQRGRYRVEWFGETVIFAMADDKHEAAARLEQLAAQYGIRVHCVPNEGGQSDEPEERRKLYQQWPWQRWCDREMALDVLNDIRRGNITEPYGTPVLCYFGFWARMLYRPTYREEFQDAPPPTPREERNMQDKAHRMLVTLVREMKVLRRLSPDGRMILFLAGDPEADQYRRF
jgi:hypothetical protein